MNKQLKKVIENELKSLKETGSLYANGSDETDKRHGIRILKSVEIIRTALGL